MQIKQDKCGGQNKRCQHCKKYFPLTSEFFNLNRSRPDGWSHLCRECANVSNREWARSHSKQLQERRRKWLKDRGPYTKEERAAFRLRSPLKACSICNKLKPRTEDNFHRAAIRADGLSGYCKLCANDLRRRSKYGLSKEQVDDLVKRQNNGCAICGKTNPQHIDHCHTTGSVRGLLCEGCNHAIGLLKDNPKLCRSAAAYLEHWMGKYENS